MTVKQKLNNRVVKFGIWQVVRTIGFIGLCMFFGRYFHPVLAFFSGSVAVVAFVYGSMEIVRHIMKDYTVWNSDSFRNKQNNENKN